MEFKDKEEIKGNIIGIVVQDRKLNDKIGIIVNLENDILEMLTENGYNSYRVELKKID